MKPRDFTGAPESFCRGYAAFTPDTEALVAVKNPYRGDPDSDWGPDALSWEAGLRMAAQDRAASITAALDARLPPEAVLH
jgi:hypothetical protein